MEFFGCANLFSVILIFADAVLLVKCKIFELAPQAVVACGSTSRFDFVDENVSSNWGAKKNCHTRLAIAEEFGHFMLQIFAFELWVL